MEQVSQLTEFGKVFIMLLTGILLVSFTLLLSRILAPNRPNALKLSSYECGEEPTGNSWLQLNTRFYVIALVFLLFDVEMIFIFPWSTIFGQEALLQAHPFWGWLTFIEMFAFVGILLLGLVYVWRRGDLEWIKPDQKLPSVNTKIPAHLYESINQETYQVRPFSAELASNEMKPRVAAPGGSSKPAFKPAFKRVSK